MQRRFSVVLATMLAAGLALVSPASASQSGGANDMNVTAERATGKTMGKGDLCSQIFPISEDSFTAEEDNIFFKQRWFDVGSSTCWSVHQTGGKRYKKVVVWQRKTNKSTGVVREKSREFHDVYSVWGIADTAKFDVDVQIWVYVKKRSVSDGWFPVYLNGTRYTTS